METEAPTNPDQPRDRIPCPVCNADGHLPLTSGGSGLCDGCDGMGWVRARPRTIPSDQRLTDAELGDSDAIPVSMAEVQLLTDRLRAAGCDVMCYLQDRHFPLPPTADTDLMMIGLPGGSHAELQWLRSTNGFSAGYAVTRASPDWQVLQIERGIKSARQATALLESICAVARLGGGEGE